MKASKTSLPDSLPDGLAIMEYEQNLMCIASEVCAIKLSHHQPVPPGHEEYMREEVRNVLKEMYEAIYGVENVVHVPLQYVEFRDLKVFDKTFISEKSRSKKSSAIIAAWPSITGILTSRHPCKDDICVGTVKYFLCHSAMIKINQQDTEKNHMLAFVDWNDNHPQKFMLGNGIVISCKSFSSSSFMPASRIISQCAIVDQTVSFDYGKESVRIALPLKRPCFT